MLNWHEFTGSEEEARELAKLLNDERRHLTREDRAAWVRKLRAKGLSTRAIADAVGVSQPTVHRMAREAGDSCESPERDGEVPLPERLAKVQELKAFGKTDDEVAEEIGVSARHVRNLKAEIAEKRKEAVPKVEGTDGKKYPAKRPEVKPVSKPGASKPSRAISLMLWPGSPHDLYGRLLGALHCVIDDAIHHNPGEQGEDDSREDIRTERSREAV